MQYDNKYCTTYYSCLFIKHVIACNAYTAHCNYTLTFNCLHFEAESEVTLMQITDTLKKLYNMYIDTATTANEKQTAYNKIKLLCKKHKVNMQNFIDNCDFDKQFETLASEKSTVQAKKREAFEANEVKTTIKKRSRRSLIIDMLFENIFSVDSINEVLSEVYNYEDLKANKKAIAGTRYDLTVNKDCFFQNCESDSRIIAFNANKSHTYKHAYIV